MKPRTQEELIKLVEDGSSALDIMRDINLGIRHRGWNLTNKDWQRLGNAYLKMVRKDFPHNRVEPRSEDLYAERCFRNAKDINGLSKVLNLRVVELPFLGGRGRLPEGISGKKYPESHGLNGPENHMYLGTIMNPGGLGSTVGGVAFEGRYFDRKISGKEGCHDWSALVYEHGGLDTMQELLVANYGMNPASIERKEVATPSRRLGEFKIDSFEVIDSSKAKIQFHIGGEKQKKRIIHHSREEGYTLELPKNVFDEFNLFSQQN